ARQVSRPALTPVRPRPPSEAVARDDARCGRREQRRCLDSCADQWSGSPSDHLVHRMLVRLPTLALLVLLALVPAAEAKVSRTLKVRFPRTVIAAGANVEMCAFVRLPVTEPFDLASYKIDQHGFNGTGLAINHFLVYLYTGERLDEFATQQNEVITSRGCLDLGPIDRDSRQMVALTRTTTSRGILPPGLSLPLVPVPGTPGGSPGGIGLLMDANWINGAT